ncbi:MAG TPA: alpha/beta fold hydrolase, partial [Kofleriaceae bacterium]|nr:alpha/beta fold hydrolase [Kofleriaceae bacterium]
PADWELLILDLPGRGKRYSEPPVTAARDLIARVVDDVRPWLDAPIALFGHSLGAILAAEVGRACEQLGAAPVWVGVSGRIAPTLQGQARRLSELDDQALLDAITGLGAMPDRVADVPDLRAHFLRVVRADLAVLESYQPTPDRPALGCAVTAFAGTSDVWAPPTTMRPWARETRGEFCLRQFDGGHFFFLGSPFHGFAREIVREIEPHTSAPRWS